MKAYIKRISALVLVLVSCFVLCSCNIKEMREVQAFYSENAGEVIYKGQVYKALPIDQLPEGLETQIDDVGYITEGDVPVLLSEMFGEWASYNHNRTIINGDAYYCREDVYDYVVNLIKYPYIDEYCIEVDYSGNYDIGYELVKQRYVNAIYSTISNGEKYNDEDYYMEVSDSVQIYKCDEKMIFQSIAFNINEIENGDIVLVVYDFEYYDSTTYMVPSDKKAIMKELLTLGEGGLF